MNVMKHLNIITDKEYEGCKYYNSVTYRQSHYHYCTWSGSCVDHSRYRLR